MHNVCNRRLVYEKEEEEAEMIRVCQFNQANFIGGLAAPNDQGVCFSLSIAWLTGRRDAGYIEALKAPGRIAGIYNDANDKRNIVQNAANGLGAVPPAITVPGVIAQIQASYGNVANVNPVPPVPAPIPANAGLFDGAANPNVIGWLINAAAGGRGHVVAWRKEVHLFFDANFGVYVNAHDADVRAHINTNYGALYNVLSVISFTV